MCIKLLKWWSRLSTRILWLVFFGILFTPVEDSSPTSKLEIKGKNTVYEGAKVTLECIVTASPAATSVAWIHEDHQIYKDEAKGISMGVPRSQTDATIFPLILNSVNRYLMGFYKCKGKNAEGEGESEAVRLYIHYAPASCKILLIHKPNPLHYLWFVEKKDIIQLQCVTDSQPAPTSYTWTQDKTTITWSHSSSGYKLRANGILELNPLLRFMTGTYTCVAANYLGSCYYTYGSYEIKVAYPPVIDHFFISKNDHGFLHLWKYAEMICVIDSTYPDVDELCIIRDNQKYRCSRQLTGLVSLRLTEFQCPKECAGNYSCSATNVAGTVYTNSTQDPFVKGGPLRINMVYPPIVIINQTSGLDPTKIRLNDTVEFTCEVVEGNPKVVISWNFDYKPISTKNPPEGHIYGPDRRTLTLSPVNAKMAGIYSCTGSNKVGWKDSTGYAISIATPAKVKVLLTNGNPKRVKMGSTIDLLCKVIIAVPKVRGVDWKFNNETIIGDKYYKIFHDRTLTVKNIAMDMEGNYTCVGHNGDFVGEWSEPLEILLIYAPGCTVVQVTELENTEVKEGENMVLQCNITADPPHKSSKWYFKGDELKNKKGVIVKDEYLELNNMTRFMTGAYKCSATNDVGTRESLPYRVIVNHKPIIGIDLTVHAPPEEGGGIISAIITGISNWIWGPATEPPVQTKGTMDVPRGATVTFDASVLAAPPHHTLEWTHDDQLITHDRSKGIFIRKKSMTIKNIKLNATGEYKCVAKNDIGETESNIIIIRVYSRPRVTLVQSTNLHQLEIKEHIDKVALLCKVIARPDVPKVYWKLNDHEISKKSGCRFSNRTLVLDPVDRSMTGNFTCEATNKHGFGKSNQYEIKVFYIPDCTIVGMGIRNPKNIKYGTSVTLSCNVKGNPKPTKVEFTLDHSLVLDDEEGIKFDGPRLKLSSVNERRSGSYRCRARNIMGECLSEPYNINVINLPDAKIRLMNIVDTNNLLLGDTVRLECVINAKFPVEPIVWKKNYKKIETSKAKSIVLRARTATFSSVDKDTSGNYTCQGKGTKESDPYSLQVIYKPEVTLVLQTLVNPRFVPEGTTLTFKCMAGGANPPIIGFRWNVDGYLMYHEPKKGILLRGDTLELSHAKRGAAGNYSCMALHVVEDVESNTISIGIKYGPEVKLSLRPDFKIDQIIEGMSPELKCEVQGNPLPEDISIIWLRNGESLQIDEDAGIVFNEETGALTLKYVNRNQTGAYTCAFFNSDGVALESNEINLDIKYAPYVLLRLTSKVNPNAIPEPSDVRFTCEVDAHPPINNVQWFHEFDPISHSKETEIKGNLLLLRDANRTRKGVYTCKATNIVDTMESEAILINFIVAPKVQLVVEDDQDTTVVQGGTLQLNCLEKETYPPIAEYRWRHKDEYIDEGNGINIDTSTLSFKSIHKDHEGEYTCEGDNGYSTGISNVVVISVIYPPVCKPTQQNTDGVLIKKNTMTDIVCNVHSYTPDVRFSWTFNNTKKRKKDSGFKVSNSGRRSTVHYIPSECEDYGTLMCWAENDAGKMEEPCIFQIYNGKPELGILKLRNKHQDPKNIKTGSNFGMACPVTCSYPPVTKYEWQINQTSLHKIRSPNILYEDENVMFKKVGRRRSGSYTCEAHNQFGSTLSKPLRITIKSDDSDDPTSSETETQEETLAEYIAKVYINRPFAYIVLADGNILLAGTYQ